MAERALRIAATADIHYGKHSRGALHDAFAEVSRTADILLFCGDLTDYGLPEEAEELVADIRASVKIPMLAVLGNHDFESGQSELVCKVLDGAGVNVLDGEAIEIGGIGFAGVPGFGGVAEERQAIPDNRIVAKVQACSRFAMGSASET